MSLFKNASPEVILLGTDDRSTRVLKPEPDPIPQHLPISYIFAKKGPGKRVIAGGSKMPLMFGAETFNQNEKWYNHATRFLVNVAGTGNTCMVHRLIPDDAGVRSNMTLYIDVLPTQVPNYVRNSFGDYVIDTATDEYKVDATNPTIPGFKIKYIKEFNPTTEEGLGMLSTKAGTMTREAANDDVKITLAGDISGTFIVGETVTGDTSGATGVVESSSYNGINTNVILSSDIGSFETTETVTTQGASTTETISAIDTELTDLIQSTMYPVLELRAKYQGEFYNNIGIGINSLYKASADEKVMAGTKSMPYTLSLVQRLDRKSSPQIVRSLFGEPAVQFSFKEKAINPNTSFRMDIEDVFNKNWFNETDPLKTLKYNDYEGLYVYREFFGPVLKMFMDAEKAHISGETKTWDDGLEASSLSWFDFTTDDAEALDEETYLINMFSCKSTKNIKYFSVMYSDENAAVGENQREINMGANTPIFLDGGSDGSLTNAEYEKLVVREMQEYADPDSKYMDLAINVESMLYDSGYTLPTKTELANFIALRKDTHLAYSTHDASMGERDLPLSEARAVGVAIKTRLKLSPESEYFGTGVMRAVILAGTGKLRDGSTADRIPLTFELAVNSGKMMGAGNGKWKRNEIFDKAPGNILKQLVDLSPAFIPAGIKPTLWADGLVWAQPYDRIQYHIPALQTVYDNDTSVLNSYFVTMACCTLSKVAAEAWRNFTGSVAMTNGQFIDAVTEYVNERVNDRFAGMFVVVPEVVITEEDELRGYSWKLITKIYASNMKTKMVHETQAWRMADL